MRKSALLILLVLLATTLARAQVNGSLSTLVVGSRGKERAKVGSFVIEFEKQKGALQLDAAVGSLLTPTVTEPEKAKNRGNFAVGKTSSRVGLLWGTACLKVNGNLEVEGGVLNTLVGVELAQGSLNRNLTYGLVWSAQPFIYPGLRLLKEVGGVTLYWELSRGRELNGNPKSSAIGAGVVKGKGKFQFSLSYFDYSSFKNLIDLVACRKFGSLCVTFNLDYQWLDSDWRKRALGVALYLTEKLSRKLYLTLRLELVKDFNSSGVYGFKESTYSLTFSPTFKVSPNLRLRGELGRVWNSTTSRFFQGVELSYLF